MMRHKQKGFTMVEIIVALAIFSLVVLFIMSLLFWFNYYNAKTKADREVVENARRAMDIIAYEIKGAQAVYFPTTTANQLSLRTFRYAPLGEQEAYIDFFVCGTGLCLKKESQSPILLTSSSVSVSNVAFSRVVNGSTVSVKMAMTVTDAHSTASVDVASTVALRQY